MNDVQINRLNSLIKSDDFLRDQSAAVAVIKQIPPLAADLNTKIQEINEAGAKGELDLTGIAEDKGNKRKKLKDQMLKVARGAAAYYQSVNKIKELRIVDYKSAELDRMRDTQLYAASKELQTMAKNDVANLINVVLADIVELDNDKEAFFEILQDPKREVEITKVQNALIDPLISKAADIRTRIDVYMQTLIATDEVLYSEWAASMSIDDTGSYNPPVLTLSIVIEANSTKAIDYSQIGLRNNTEIKLTNFSAVPLDFGFGIDDQGFATKPITVNPNAKLRKTAIGLGYDASGIMGLNIRNNEAVPAECTVEFYRM